MTNEIGLDYILLVVFLGTVMVLDYKFDENNSSLRILKKNVPLKLINLRLGILVLWFMAAFRGLDVTNDTEAYYGTMQKIARYGLASETRMEKAYTVLNYFILEIFGSVDVGFHVLLFLSASLIYYAIYRMIKNRAHSYGICLWAFYFLINSGYMSAIRQSIAVAIVILALDLLKQKKYILYVLAVILAVFFHKSAIIALSFLIIYNVKYNRLSGMLIILASVLITTTNLALYVLMYLSSDSIYITTEIGNAANVTVMSFLYIMLLMLQMFARSYYRHNGYGLINDKYSAERDFSIYCIVCSLAITIMSLRLPVISRFSDYFLIAGLPYISNVMKDIRNKKISTLIKIVFAVAVWGYSFIVLIYRPEWQHLWPYHFWWN